MANIQDRTMVQIQDRTMLLAGDYGIAAERFI